MAAPVTQVLESGDRNHVIHVIGEADTVGGTIVDVSALATSTRGDVVTSVKLDKIQYSTDATIKLDWDATADVTFQVLAPGQDNKDYRYTGGIPNNAGAGVTGDVLVPAPAGAANYEMTLWFRKKY